MAVDHLSRADSTHEGRSSSSVIGVTCDKHEISQQHPDGAIRGNVKRASRLSEPGGSTPSHLKAR
eukprot:6213687-Pleurochrysis_carterae.AAC.3